jgi:2-polyprenyl-3-methyl-5-hydroxy-6-metoxy-1,4-benzoquinol methylase
MPLAAPPMPSALKRFTKKLLRAVANHDPGYYDMYLDQREARFAELYLKRIQKHFQERGIAAPARVLDAGCQTGRLLVPFAQAGYTVTGIDRSAFALRRARAHLRKAGAKGELIRGGIGEALSDRTANRYDAAICAEVLYLCEDYRALLGKLASSVKPGGLLCVSHRPQAYYLVEALRAGDMDAASFVLANREGAFRGDSYYNWQTESELRSLYEELGLSVLALYPIDRFAWLAGLDVGSFDSATHQEWLNRELETPQEGGLCARYGFVIASRDR